MSIRLQSIVLSSLLAISAQVAHAAIFDFANLVDTSNGSISGTLANGTVFSGNPSEAAFSNFTWNVDNLSLTASGSHATDTSVYAYLDKGNAGLGVCQNATSSNQCSPSSDDNVTLNEVLYLSFDKIATIDFSDSVFRNSGHGVFNPSIEINIDGLGWNALDITGLLTASLFEFRVLNDREQFYISSLSVTPVPEPSTYLLMGLGLLVLGLSLRKQP
ncbi:MAG: hypothetical protein BMS9Abin26_1497 [Gammaproteobacteria bacterium]|nr:MAG: hypothetical protein BMS9Abin26_1497 [Gammaproteobacteria bacterium]